MYEWKDGMDEGTKALFKVYAPVSILVFIQQRAPRLQSLASARVFWGVLFCVVLFC
jgi:hypothetical protein